MRYRDTALIGLCVLVVLAAVFLFPLRQLSREAGASPPATPLLQSEKVAKTPGVYNGGETVTTVSKLKVEGGWLYIVEKPGTGVACTFVPDTK